MAGEIQLDYGESGKNLYALILNASGQIWNGSTFEAINAANWATYAIVLTEQSTSGIYVANFPAVAAGAYGVSMRLRSGASPATGDQVAATVNSPVHWDGSAEILPASRAEYTAAKAAYLDASIAAVKTKTDNLPTDPADQSLVIAATDSILTRLGAPAGVSVSADIATIEAQTDDIGIAGAGLTALGDTRLANLDATISSRATVAAILAGVIEGTLTLKQVLRIALAWFGGKATGGGTTTITFRDPADTQNRVVMTVDSNGNRSAVTLDVTD